MADLVQLDGIKKPILDILSNKELIAFNQDPVYGASVSPYKWGINPDWTWNQSHPAEYWSGRSSKGVHVFMLNTLGTSVTKTATWREIPELNATKHDKYHVHDMWTGEDLGEFTNSFSIKIRSHDTAALRLTREDSKFNIFLTVLPQAHLVMDPS